jgi:tRNA dimethylallyltransferase
MSKPGELHSSPSILQPRPLVLAGPTAVGKSDVALLLAEKLGGEIVSVDSMQVYRGLDVGTAKPSPADRARVSHHLIDVADLTEPFDAAQFVRLAREAVAQIQARGHVPIFCGGTGLYFRAFLEGLGEAPPADARLRAELEAMPLADMLRELEQRDPATFARIDRQNPRRVIRALEVVRLTGKPFSAQRAEWKAEVRGGKSEVAVGLARTVEDLRRRIDTRVDQMFARGLVEETQRLLDGGLAQNPTAMQAIGYRQVVEHLRGGRSLEATIELVKTRTRQFAKRQMTWFRGQMRLEWIESKPDTSLESVAALVEARYRS